jgi:nucleotide-binding universal stress UspA family protein
MHLSHIMVAVDESDTSRQALEAGRALANRSGARLTVVRVLPLHEPRTSAALEQLQRWAQGDAEPSADATPTSYAVAYGLPGVEIGRIAESLHADLLVLGRTPRSDRARLLLGDTADAVARRSRVPCLFVPPRRASAWRLLVAVDGSERGAVVLRVASELARQPGVDLRFVTVEPAYAGEPVCLAAAMPSSRSARVRAQVREAVGHDLEVRRGEPAEQILAAIGERGRDVVVLGYHRGGPAGVVECGSTARRVMHAAPCAVLTVPL